LKGQKEMPKLFDYLEGGDTLDEFLRQFPSVRREQAIAALEQARDSVLFDNKLLTTLRLRA
jgi:uncharacterized protein (DUF433 family)